jgi:hypothetical protein
VANFFFIVACAIAHAMIVSYNWCTTAFGLAKELLDQSRKCVFNAFSTLVLANPNSVARN